MNLVNATTLMAGYTVAIDKTGREWIVVVAKGTYGIPTHPDEEPKLLAEQVPLVMCDEFTGAPGVSTPLYENDFALRKPMCDVLLNGSAYAPSGNSTHRVAVSLGIGLWQKSFDVIGDRTWNSGLLSAVPSAAKPFVSMPISYSNAFGGVDRGVSEYDVPHYFAENFVGVGYHVRQSGHLINDKPLPNTEETARRISEPDGSYRPMAFGPLGRAWKQRVQFAGTYDQNWVDHVFPFLPEDFDERYFQAAPSDQQINYPTGGEEVELVNLTPQGRTTFQLPELRVPVEFYYKNDSRKTQMGDLDTIVFEPDCGRFMMCSRTCLPLRRSLHELKMAVVGRMAEEWYVEQGLEPRRPGKRRFKSLVEMIAWKKQREITE